MYDKPLSYSGLSLYRACPRLWYDNYVLGNKQPSGKAAERGTILHDKLEKYFKGEAPYPSSDSALRPWQSFMETLATFSPIAEGEVAVNRNWEPTSFEDPNAFFRGKKDLEIHAGRTLLLYDWKSGGIYDDHVYQGEAYSSLTPGYDEYRVYFVYLDHPYIIKGWTYQAEDVQAKREVLHSEIEHIRAEAEFPATPGSKCKYCHLSWRNGGDCKRAR